MRALHLLQAEVKRALEYGRRRPGPAQVPSPYYRMLLQTVTTERKAALGETLINTQSWSFGGTVAISITDELWSTPPGLGRSNMFLIHQLPFLEPLIAHDRHQRVISGTSLAVDIVRSWWAAFEDGSSKTHKMAWHDHATALRLTNLLLLRAHLLDTRSSAAFPELDSICRHHADLLSRDDFHTWKNNHGLDQSLALLLAAFELPAPEHVEVARSRIRGHLERAFAPDGGHVENSPGYQRYGLLQAARAAEIGRYYLPEDETLGLSEEVLAKACLTFAFMTRPDGNLPFVGDTVQKAAPGIFKHVRPKSLSQLDYALSSGRSGERPTSVDLVLPDSGWAIFREHWEEQNFDRALHIMFKAGFRSRAHRHDDDLAFTLFGFDEEWITDGGLYKYEEKDPYRIYCRSARAHSLPHPVDVEASRDLTNQGATISKHGQDGSRSWVQGVTPMFAGHTISRHLQYDRLDNSLRIVDEAYPVSGEAKRIIDQRLSNGERTYATRFLVPSDKTISITAGGVLISGGTRRLQISAELPTEIVIGKKAGRIKGWRSQRLDRIEPAYDISFYCMEPTYEASFRLNWV